jgi:hypothetical protein
MFLSFIMFEMVIVVEMFVAMNDVCGVALNDFVQTQFVYVHRFIISIDHPEIQSNRFRQSDAR